MLIDNNLHLISIIIPVYNVEKYLRQCLDSIINQTFTDFECICVNDGSTDNSLKILQEYAKKDSRFKVISQENKGTANAKNYALNCAKGDYVVFVDSDDTIDINYLKILSSFLIDKNVDMVQCNYKLYYEDKKIYNSCTISKENYLYSTKEAENKFLKMLSSVLWNNIFKLDIIKTNNICFFDVSSNEDWPFVFIYSLYTKDIFYIKDELYVYNKHTNTLSCDKSKMSFNKASVFLKLVYDLDKRKLLNDKLINTIFNAYIWELNTARKTCNHETLNAILSIFREFLVVIKDKQCNTKNKFIFKLYTYMINIFGTNSYCFFRIIKNLYKI